MRVVIIGAGATGRELAERLMGRFQTILVDSESEGLAQCGRFIRYSDFSESLLRNSEGLICVNGDGTSRLLLQTFYRVGERCALVAVADRDEVNLEIGRLSRIIGYEPIVAIQHKVEFAAAYQEAHITTIERSQILANQIELSLRHQGAVLPMGIGLGKGELIQIRLVASSPVVGRPLRSLAPHEWRVAAVFREEEVIVPTGDTVLAADDRLLLVGKPEMLTNVADSLRLGVPKFPKQFGPHVVTVEPGGEDERILDEAQYVALSCEAAMIRRALPGPVAGRAAQEGPSETGESQGMAVFELPTWRGPGFAERIGQQRPGVVVKRPELQRWYQKLLGLANGDGALCDALSAPVLFAKGSTPYRRILLPISPSHLSIHAAYMAIDITRQLKASLTVVSVELPIYLTGPGEDGEPGQLKTIRQLCELYDVPIQKVRHEGNPITQILTEANVHDLVVVARHRGRRDSWFNPDVAIRVARRSPCSVIVLTVEGRR